jgi:two-component system CheB/CheR fusion protein
MLKTKVSIPKKTKKRLDSKSPKPFPIVGFGASAGGLEAFSAVLANLEFNLGMAYVLVMHLAPHHKSALTQILQSKTRMPVQTVKDGMEVMANNVYVIPPNTCMSIVDGHLKLSPRSSSVGNYAVDFFLTGLAAIYKNNAIGVILSGTASDGTLGLKAIKAEGGITFAQDDSAKFSGMPGNAYEAGYVDFRLSPIGIAQEIARLVTVPYTHLSVENAEIERIIEANRHTEELKKILSLVKHKFGIDFFLHYKRASIYRRVIRRMVLNKIDKLEDYHSFLGGSAKEVDALYEDFLINVTIFFRDPDFFKTLKQEVFPSFLKSASIVNPIRIWIAGCATGEEAYSVAIELIEFLEKKEVFIPFQIFASDLDAGAIDKARLGIYPSSALQEISSERLKRFFKKIDGHYQVIKSVREVCIFSQHNLLRDPPFSRINLISCQNVLIYLENNPQQKILQTFHYALRPTGFLFLGKSESIGASIELFQPLDKKIRLFSRKPAKPRVLKFSIDGPAHGELKIEIKKEEKADEDSDMYKLMLTRFVYPGVVVNKNMTITQFFGITSKYLTPVAGKASFNLLKMLHDDLLIPVRGLLQLVRRTEKPASEDRVRVKIGKVAHEISIEVVPKKTSHDIFFLIVFKEQAHSQIPQKNSGSKSNVSSSGSKKVILKLEDELRRSREIIRTTTEEYETTYEELQANNEEILSSNEELQSVNEELESSKEELQSANEELTTANEESRKRNIDLFDSQNYTNAILESIHSPLLVLNANLQIRIANKAFYEMFKLTQEKTEGYFLYELGDNAWDIPSLREQLKEVFLKVLNFKEFEIKHSFPGIGQRIQLVHAYRFLRGENQQETFIMLVFDDITRRVNSEAELHKSQEQLKLSLIGDSVGTWRWTISTGEMKWSLGNELLNGIKEGTFEGFYESWENIILPEDLPKVRKGLQKAIHDKLPVELEYRILWPDNTIHWILSKGHIYFDDAGMAERIIGVSMDNTERMIRSENLEKQATHQTAELFKSNRELSLVNKQLEQFAFISSHDLQEPLRKIATFSDFLSQPEGHLNKYAENYVGKIKASASRMSDLVRDLLAFSVLGASDRKFIRVDLTETVKNVLENFKTIIKAKGVFIHDFSLPAIMAEPVQMYKLFHNLIENALKFGRENPEIWITSRKASSADYVKYPVLLKNTVYFFIKVRDNGLGFNQDFVAKIFSIFQRLSDTSMAGTGIGLAICKRIIDNHQGFIYANGKENAGAEFIIFLPESQGEISESDLDPDFIAA